MSRFRGRMVRNWDLIRFFNQEPNLGQHHFGHWHGGRCLHNHFFRAAGHTYTKKQRYRRYLNHHVLYVYFRCITLGYLWLCYWRYAGISRQPSNPNTNTLRTNPDPDPPVRRGLHPKDENCLRGMIPAGRPSKQGAGVPQPPAITRFFGT